MNISESSLAHGGGSGDEKGQNLNCNQMILKKLIKAPFIIFCVLT